MIDWCVGLCWWGKIVGTADACEYGDEVRAQLKWGEIETFSSGESCVGEYGRLLDREVVAGVCGGLAREVCGVCG
jgi:hypothetical protein